MTDPDFSETGDGDGATEDGRTAPLDGDCRTGGGDDTTGDAAASEYAEMPGAEESDATGDAHEDISEHALTSLFEALAGLLQAGSAAR
ncbi:hypothetical protein ACWDUL_37660 [Nocardia niigatensis]|uniref:hypothetical protein n=1 Tax=Nocardia niigatensis TaxID=209249 RepID=UPI0002DE3406|nr:hypothetical protein [Nocardia niigatensis]